MSVTPPGDAGAMMVMVFADNYRRGRLWRQTR
jgi:hypothetical protein